MFVYSTGILNYAQYFYKDTNDCKDSTLVVGMDSTIKKIPFSLGANQHAWVYITQLPTKGILKTTAGATLSANNKFSITDVNYAFTTLNADTFKYSTNSVDAACTVTITPCYTSCFSCTTVGIPTDHQCNICDSNNARVGGSFYPLEDNPSMCYQSSENPLGYYLSNNSWKKCYIKCKSCTGYPTDVTVNMLCTTCATGFYPKSDSMTNCFTGTITIPGYSFDGTQFLKCYSSCQDCSTIPGDANNNQCTSCLTGYYPPADIKTNCFKQGAIVDGYYFDGTQYQPCYLSCKTCTTTGTSTDHQCTVCKDGYYPQDDKITNCFTGTVDGFNFDSSTSTYKACYSTCKTCTTSPFTETDNECLTCITNYFPKSDIMKNCYTGTQLNYYFDGMVYQPCYSTCQTCTTIKGDATNNQCLKCISNYYPKVDNKNNCFTDPVPQYYFDGTIFQKCYPSCQTCKSIIPTITNHQCNICLAGYYPKADNLTSCFTGNLDNYYLDANNIYQQCFTSCKSCKVKGDYTDNKCDSCLDNYYPSVDNMTSCFKTPLDLYYLDSNNIFQKCYSLCRTCSKGGTDSDNQCATCIQDYYHKIDDTSNCFTDPIDLYYLDKDIYRKCYPSCQSCNGAGTDSDHACSKCQANYYPKKDNRTSCFTGNIDYYYLDISVYVNCYFSCQTCTGAGTDTDNLCSSCKKGYRLVTGTNNCEATGEPLVGLYYDMTKKIYNSCFPTCLQCTGLGTILQQNCIQCVDGCYPVEGDKNGQCYPKDTNIPNHYFDEDMKMFENCYSSCDTCSAGGTDSQHNCIECGIIYAHLIDSQSMCFNITDDIEGYFYDGEGDVFKRCYKTCLKCNEEGDGNNHNCSACIENTYPTEDGNGFCYNRDDFVRGYYFDEELQIFKKCYKSCSACTGPGDSRNPNCKECLDSETDCSGCADFIYKDTCVKTCPEDTIYDLNNKRCLHCGDDQIFFNNICIDNCEDGYIKQNNTCVSCKSLNKYFYNIICVDSCPEDTIIDEVDKLCIDILSGNKGNNTLTNNDLNDNSFNNNCEDSTCENGGTCSIRFGLIYCDCQTHFTGVNCQLQIRDSLGNYISKIIFNPR
jgi:hypothetical protein